MGGHKWSISGYFDDLVIPSMPIMLVNKEHPKEVKVEKGSFANIVFDDNAEEILNKAFEQLKKK
ncbi:MAG: hypothetical protein C4308_12500 [Chitinophagaceae bacterium]